MYSFRFCDHSLLFRTVNNKSHSNNNIFYYCKLSFFDSFLMLLKKWQDRFEIQNIANNAAQLPGLIE